MKPLNPTCKLGGRYKIEAFVPGNPKRVVADWFENLITDYAMNRMLERDSNLVIELFSYCHVGTGNTPPSFADTQLAGYKASVNYNNNVYGRANDYVWMRKTFYFPQGAASGNLSEIGIGQTNSANGAKLLSRALIKDAQGVPTSITVLPDEILQVTWEMRVYWPQATVSGTVEIAGSGTHDFELAACSTLSAWGFYYGSFLAAPEAGYSYVYSDFGALLPITQTPHTNSDSSDYMGGGREALPYVEGSFVAKAKLIVPIGRGNFSSGINGFTFASYISDSPIYQVCLSPPIMKTANDSLKLTVSTSLARV